MSNIDTVRAIYEAFGKQDVPAILERIAEDVEWEYAYPDRGIPWLAPRRGREGALGFFQAVGAELAFERFEIAAICGDGDVVIALANLTATVRRTGKRIVEEHEAHLWWFDAKGRVRRFRHAADTLQHMEAWRQ